MEPAVVHLSSELSEIENGLSKEKLMKIITRNVPDFDYNSHQDYHIIEKVRDLKTPYMETYQVGCSQVTICFERLPRGRPNKTPCRTLRSDPCMKCGVDFLGYPFRCVCEK